MPTAKESVKTVPQVNPAKVVALPKAVPQAVPQKPAAVAAVKEPEQKVTWKYFWTVMRISVGFIFLWPFLDKLFGFGISTAAKDAWINGGSPTAGFLLHGTQGPFVNIFHSLASSSLVSWLFMLGLLFVGLTMLSGIGLRLSAIVGTVMLALMWLAMLPPSDNPFLDYHWFYAFALIASALTNAGNYFGFGKWWSNLNFVKQNPILK